MTDQTPGLELTYPCRWEYTVIGTVEADMRAAIAEVIGDRSCTVAPSRRSRGGKYCSLRVEVLVLDEAMRRGVYDNLYRHPSVRMVL